MEGLPEVFCKYGSDDGHKSYASQFAVRTRGGMTASLWREYVRKVIKKVYKGRLAKVPLQDPVTEKLIKGPVIAKTDGGPGRLAMEMVDIEFREELWEMGIVVLLSLPNATECEAECDRMYEDLKPACKTSTNVCRWNETCGLCEGACEERGYWETIRDGVA